MTQDNLVELKKPESFIDDPLTTIVRKGARNGDRYLMLDPPN